MCKSGIVQPAMFVYHIVPPREVAQDTGTS